MSQVSEGHVQSHSDVPNVKVLDSSQQVQSSSTDSVELEHSNVNLYELGLLLSGLFGAMNSLSYDCHPHYCHYHHCCYGPQYYFDYTAPNYYMSPSLDDELG